MSSKVFGVGDVTICSNQEELRLYVGHLEVSYIKKLEVKFENNKAYIDVSFFTSHEPETAKSIEEAVRTVKTIPWIRVNP